MESRVDDNPYLLLTPGPLSTTRTVRQAMLRDWCTWDDDYNQGVVQVIRQRLVEIATDAPDRLERYTTTLMQGSGTFCVESVVGSALPADGKLLVVINGAYGRRIARIAEVLRIACVTHDMGELEPPNIELLARQLDQDPTITHVAMVHGETTTGMLCPLEAVAAVAKDRSKVMIVDAMSTFGGVPLDMDQLGIDFLISSANKCIQGVPGFGLIVARRDTLARCAGQARSLSLDLYDQWTSMEQGSGKWRFTSPTHTVRAFAQALEELSAEGGVAARHARYCENQRVLVEGMIRLGFRCLLPRDYQSPIITAFYNPDSKQYRFREFYDRLKTRGFVIYPGKVTDCDTFRIGTIGNVYPDDVRRLLTAVKESIYWSREGCSTGET
jgi:2-aminoethylphosphonate-pyruvate transaminase